MHVVRKLPTELMQASPYSAPVMSIGEVYNSIGLGWESGELKNKWLWSYHIQVKTVLS
jgi:hypothetical protein